MYSWHFLNRKVWIRHQLNISLWVIKVRNILAERGRGVRITNNARSIIHGQPHDIWSLFRERCWGNFSAPRRWMSCLARLRSKPAAFRSRLQAFQPHRGRCTYLITFLAAFQFITAGSSEVQVTDREGGRSFAKNILEFENISIRTKTSLTTKWCCVFENFYL